MNNKFLINKMKFLLTVATTLVLIFSTTIGVNAEKYNIIHAGDDGVYAYYGTPKIDGQIDDMWSQSTPMYTEWAVYGVDFKTWEGTGLYGSYGKAMWDEKYLYILIVSTDTTPVYANKWLEEDKAKGAEAQEYTRELSMVWITETNNDMGVYHRDEGCYYFHFYRSDTKGNKGSNTIADSTFPSRVAMQAFCDYAVKDNGKNGYIAEAKIPWTVGEPENDYEIGLNFTINDDVDGDGDREYHNNWTGKKFIGNNNYSDLGTVVLTGAPEKKPESSSSETVNSNASSSTSSKVESTSKPTASSKDEVTSSKPTTSSKNEVISSKPTTSSKNEIINSTDVSSNENSDNVSSDLFDKESIDDTSSELGNEGNIDSSEIQNATSTVETTDKTELEKISSNNVNAIKDINKSVLSARKSLVYISVFLGLAILIGIGLSVMFVIRALRHKK